jgi:hypothetical protein
VSYELSVCPAGSTTGCISKTCSPVTDPGTTTCPVTGLTAGTGYEATATCVKVDGTMIGPSAPGPFTTPAAA